MAVPKWGLREGEAPAEPAFATCADRPDALQRPRPACGPARRPATREPWSRSRRAGAANRRFEIGLFDPLSPPNPDGTSRPSGETSAAYIAESEAGRDVESLVEELLS